MVIRKILMENFCGVDGIVEMELPHIVAVIGKNGMGKTTLMNAIRFGLTGAEPEGDIINKNRNWASVEITLDGLTVKREKCRTTPSKFYVDGKTTTQKALNEKVESVIGIPLDKIKILAAADVLAAMKPQEFASLILEYIPEKIGIEKVVDLMPEMTPGIMDIIDANLPVEGIDLQTLDEFDEFCRLNRKEFKSDLQAKKLMFEKHQQEAPEEDRAMVEKRLKELANIENEYKLYLVKLDAYNKAVEARRKVVESIQSMKAEAEAITTTRPDPAKMDGFKKRLGEINDSLISSRASIAGVNSAITTLTSTLEALDKSFCPISPLITCGQDKSAAKTEIQETLDATKESAVLLEKEIEKLEKQKTEVEAQIEAEGKLAKEYDRKIMLLKQIKIAEDSLTEEPKKPDEIKKADVETEQFQLEQKLKIIRDYEEGQQILSNIKALEVIVADYEALVKALSEKGPVRNGIVKSYLSIFEDLCNERSQKIRPEISFRFESNNGVIVWMNNGTTELTYPELSGGEKAYMVYVLLDMLNQLVGTKILFLDELSVLDQEAFTSLVELVLNYAEDYDHIILSAVDHEDTVKVLESHEVNCIKKII